MYNYLHFHDWLASSSVSVRWLFISIFCPISRVSLLGSEARDRSLVPSFLPLLPYPPLLPLPSPTLPLPIPLPIILTNLLSLLSFPSPLSVTTSPSHHSLYTVLKVGRFP